MFALYTIKFEPVVQLGKAANCSEEISTYLQKHKNWNNLIWDPVAGCPIVNWIPDFVQSGLRWICDDLAASQGILK